MRNARVVVLDWLRACLAAFQFLTRLPIPVQIDYTERVFRRSVVFYPLAGCVIGLLLLLAGKGLGLILPPMPAAVLLLGLWIVLTGGLHLDGLMDTADGILSHRPREMMLEIMKDSRVGAMGVIVCVLHVLLKFAILYSLLDLHIAGHEGGVSFLIVLVPVWSRWFMVMAIYGWPYARKESGLGSLFRSVRKSHVSCSLLVALLTTTITASLALGRGSYAALADPKVWIIVCGYMLVTLIAGWIFAAYMNSKLGGLTGDTYGALNELLETVLLVGVLLITLTQF
ncbi:adenosylcobinamide-GDP ribazoletransferase [Paenibacillus sp. HWE-109]|uniref:adenosylcobinamide-GDP ribazoletransferase n=1 Tax=Paenibacillus sp. HWE-109 TaxID=1306526 RepID=UPI001EDF25BB|nr:adenosylcobinamide-GDP ribazoletransferase [Paenibacillus sp. HWE-109]UKS24651.1 adenosylcobinamide-GDP ribazoletransferase [Paenibacillus sp. HWE-109]